MPSRDLLLPVRMRRVALVAPRERLRDALVGIAELGTVELVGAVPAAEGEEVEALRRLERAQTGGHAGPACLRRSPEAVADMERSGEWSALAGEVELLRRAAMAHTRGSFAVLVGWTPRDAMSALDDRLAEAGGAAVELPVPAWADPPTLVAPSAAGRSFGQLVATYGVIPYADVDPLPFAAVSFVLMFAIMFGDVGHGLVLAALGAALGRWGGGRLQAYRRAWPLLVAAGLAAAVAGLLYGEAFGPTGLVPALWLHPVDEPGPLLVAALAVGVVMLSIGHVYGIVNRWREHGPGVAVLSQTGIAGLATLLGLATAGLGWYVGMEAALYAGLAVVAVSGVLLGIGFVIAAGGGLGLLQAGIELLDAFLRTASNIVSFTRLAAFGIMHAALGAVVVAQAGAVWGGPVGSAVAVAIFVLGNLVAFSLELLVTGIQALRLEFYELFSRVFTGQGHPFAPWALPVTTKEES
jgi:V/A-type H+/Na+-transporting ATPase subunit I